MLSCEDRLRKAINVMETQRKKIADYEKEISDKNDLIESNSRNMNQMYDEMGELKEKIKALVSENEDLIETLERAKETITSLEHDASIGNGFKELVKAINIEK